MPRIKLANWYGDKAPGEELDVDDVTLKALRRDGLVADVIESQPENTADTSTVPATEPQPSEQPETGRKRR